MGCEKITPFLEMKEKIKNLWTGNRTLQKWNFADDKSRFKELFFEATNKDFEAGVDINIKDLKKFEYKVLEQIDFLKNPSINDQNKLKKTLWTGFAKAEKNPITKDFFKTLSDAQAFRLRHSNNSSKQYQKL